MATIAFGSFDLRDRLVPSRTCGTTELSDLRVLKMETFSINRDRRPKAHGVARVAVR
jgi:hypothetical protein